MTFKFNYYLYLIVVLATFSSCGMFRKMLSKDTVVNKPIVKSTKQHPITFLDNIEVQPGQVVTSKHKTSGLKNDPILVASGKLIPSNIESVNWLQLKYAIVMDAAVESLNNVSLLKKIDEWWGTKYCMGGSTKNCIDCSSFSQTILKEVYGISLPRTAQDQYNISERIALEDLKEGDLVFFHTSGKSKRISHVGVYMANNKFVQASTSNGVTITDLNDSYWQPRYKGAGRVMAH